MVGSWVINFFFGLFGFMLVFISAFSTNNVVTSLIRGSMAFVAFYLIGYLFRWIIYFIMQDTKGHTTKNSLDESEQTPETHPSTRQQDIESLTDEEAKRASEVIKQLIK